MDITLKNVVKSGQSQAVAISQTDQVVSDVWNINHEDSLALAFEVTAASVSGVAGIVKLQNSFDGVNFVDVDSTNAIVTVTAAGRFPKHVCSSNSNLADNMPLAPYIRFVCTTTGADALTVTKILVTTTR